MEIRMEFSERSLIGFLLTVVLVSACGEGSGDINSAATLNTNIQQSGTNIQQTSGDNFSAIAGVWDESHNYDGLVDVLYWVINADGTFANVDYRGDDFNNDGHCYDYFRGRVTTFGADGYVFDAPGSNQVTVTPLADGSAIISPNSSSLLVYLRVINGELAILDGSNGQPDIFLPPVAGGLDPSIPECTHLSG